MSNRLLRSLRAAGLTVDLKRLIGTKFLFSATEGSHSVEIAGTITALCDSDTRNLSLAISWPEFRGDPLLYLSWDAEYQRWSAVTRNPDGSKNFNAHGSLVLL